MARSSPKPPPIRRPCRAIHDRRQPATAASSIGPGAGMVSRVDAYQQRHRWAGLPLAVLYKFADDQGTYLAAQITYYGFVALFPLLLLLATILGYALHGNQHLMCALVRRCYRILFSGNRFKQLVGHRRIRESCRSRRPHDLEQPIRTRARHRCTQLLLAHRTGHHRAHRQHR